MGIAGGGVGSTYTPPRARVPVLAGLSNTLETVLSQAMARDVLNANYVPRTAPCRIAEALGLEALDVIGVAGGGGRQGDLTRFPIRTTPAEAFPVIDVDRQLLSLVYRNAMSNACKYGKQDGVVRTEITLEVLHSCVGSSRSSSSGSDGGGISGSSSGGSGSSGSGSGSGGRRGSSSSCRG